MTEQLIEIGTRLAALRDICELTSADIAEKMGISEEEYLSYENGERDFSFSFLYNAADILGVDVLDIISGDSPKLSICSVVRKGEGYTIQRRSAYDYRHLAYTFRKKKAEPFMVTVEPKDDTTPTLHDHAGQEFNYMVSGRMRFYIGDISYDLEEGDSVYFDSGVPHAMKALDGKPAKFLAVVIK
ncbi:MAG: helix-turn-helix domain-containing protein [Eubacteriales bacterium]|jgi:quercetin dioxygenase-like cupin family protein/DNA-binding XRE family transcriptional regulator